jgi:hypothetical protein
MEAFAALPIPLNYKAPEELCPLKIKHRMKMHFQIVFGQLPTMARQHSWYPQVYVDALCKSCELEVETEQHVRSCGANVLWGRAIQHHAAFRELFAQQAKLDLVEARDWLAVYEIPTPPMACDELWYGIVKPEWIESAVTNLRMRRDDAVEMWKSLVWTVRDQFLDVWKARNEKQIAWEAQHEITFRKKREMKSRNAGRNRAQRRNPGTKTDYHAELLRIVNDDLQGGCIIGMPRG